MTIYMVWKNSTGKYDVLTMKPEKKLCSYIGNQDSWWTRPEYIIRTVEVKKRADLQKMYIYLFEQGYAIEDQI